MEIKLKVGLTHFGYLVRAGWDVSGVKFVTEDKDFLQVGLMSYDNGKVFEDHFHNKIKRSCNLTQEAIYLLEGELNAILRCLKTDKKIEISILEGDLLILLDGAHKFEVVKSCKLIEFKNGPYLKKIDKTWLR